MRFPLRLGELIIHSPNTTLSIGVASFSLRFYLYVSATFWAQAKACYSILWLNDKVVLKECLQEV